MRKFIGQVAKGNMRGLILAQFFFFAKIVPWQPEICYSENKAKHPHHAT